MSDLLIPQKKIFVVSKPQPIFSRQATKEELTNRGTCKKCGRRYKWTVQRLEQHAQPDSEQEDRQTRAMALFREYAPTSDSKLAEIGHCCAEREHRIFIRDNVGMVQYE